MIVAAGMSLRRPGNMHFGNYRHEYIYMHTNKKYGMIFLLVNYLE
jgi:hypothetical protein